MPTEYETFFNKWIDCDYTQGFYLRAGAIKLMGFAVLTESAIEALKPFGPFVEVGAGTGYWAHEMKKRGIESIATDPAPAACGNTYKFERTWTPLEKLDGVQAVQKYNHTLLLVWPCYDEDWAYETLQAYTGDTLVYCGEGWGGCTADDGFFELLDDEWEVHQVIDIPQWRGIHDRLTVYRRKGNPK